jgi:hypothetical protein
MRVIEGDVDNHRGSGTRSAGLVATVYRAISHLQLASLAPHSSLLMLVPASLPPISGGGEQARGSRSLLQLAGAGARPGCPLGEHPAMGVGPCPVPASTTGMDIPPTIVKGLGVRFL